MIRFCLVPGRVKSQHDGEVHHVGAGQLARLYELRPSEWQVHGEFRSRPCDDLQHLYPSYSGSYGRPR